MGATRTSVKADAWRLLHHSWAVELPMWGPDLATYVPVSCGSMCWVVGQITGHLWHHIAGSWAHIPWLELALSLCLCHTLSLCLRTCTLHPSLISLVTAVTVTFPLFAMVRAYA